MNNRNSRRRPGGYSLLEVLIGLFILGIITSLTSYSLLKSSPRYQLRQAVWALLMKLNQARYLAVLKNTSHRCVIRHDGVYLEKRNSASLEWEMLSFSHFSGVKIKANNSPVFHPRGTVSPLASIVIENAAGAFKITIAISGRIKTVKIK
ncbi:prepilin-type N-terminal cleavage/methylation domain-containing protein [Candidatus Aminicenantes bacterium AC-334-K16]|jgi:prepilin-type N-terminal cleavage/methylation domain-containing protein|nr:prepilin-type N-terminal cleavage/methylation domain-containing protein [Candidatus Aminicenantes bacterium AC-334-K16]